MPMYEYKCHGCGTLFEVRQSFSDDPVTTHDCAAGGPVEKLLSVPALQFKGSGFYITDYARGGESTKAGGANGAAAAESSGKSEAGKSESSGKSEPTKTESKPVKTESSTPSTTSTKE